MGSAYVPIGDYGLIADCHGAALVSREGSIDWCCIPRFDSGACFARLLDAARGGYCAVEATGRMAEPGGREYVDGSLVLATTLTTEEGQARVIDCLTMGPPEEDRERRELARIVEGGGRGAGRLLAPNPGVRPPPPPRGRGRRHVRGARPPLAHDDRSSGARIR